MVQNSLRRLNISALTAISTLTVCPPLLAQTTQVSPPSGAAVAGNSDIIVTARKRTETALDVPVAITALGKGDLARYASHDLVAISQQVPGLIIQPMAGGAGGSIALRGISSSTQNPAIDQSVSFNIDGVQVGSANIIRLGQIDVQQMEVLKGPQALFFGKNSPGGVISIRTVDPGDHWQGSATVDHEIYGAETSVQGAVGGPLTDKLGVRVVGYYDWLGGYLRNDARVVPGTDFGPANKWGPHRHEIYFRGTAVYKPFSGLTVRAKYNFDKLHSDSSPFDGQQRIACPYGAPQLGAYPHVDTDCTMNGTFVSGRLDPRLVAAYPNLFPYEGARSTQHLASLDINYALARDITLSSVTGYYKIKDGFLGSASYQSGSPLIAGTYVSRRDISEEVRLTTSRQDWPVNFMVGGYYQSSKFFQQGPTIIATTPGVITSVANNEFFVDGTSYSFFGQGIWKVFPKLELAGGLRWSKESKNVDGIGGVGISPTLTSLRPLVDHISFTDTSPEVTLTYKPTHQFSLFGAWRNGFKSGGFNTGGSFAVGGKRIDYLPEDISGFEAGMKMQTRTVRANLTAYTYRYKNLQVSTFDPLQLIQTVVNAATARIKGIEGDVLWHTPVEGLDLRGSANYNHARYTSFLVGCYTGQTVAEGCNVNPGPTGAFRQQDFKGRPLTLAPNWSANAGVDYTHPLDERAKFGITADAFYSSGFWAQLEEEPGGYQRSFWTFDASARVSSTNDKLELALIGRNLSNVYRARFVSQVPLTGISSRTGTTTSGGLSDLSGLVNRGREIRLQFTVKFD